MMPSCSSCDMATRSGTIRNTRWKPEWRCQMSMTSSRSMSLPQLATIVPWNSRLTSENAGPSCASTAARIFAMSASSCSSSASVMRSAARPVAMLSRCERMKYVSSTSLAVIVVTLAPRYGAVSTRPSRSSMRSASRTGMSLASYRFATSRITGRVPGAMSLDRIRSRRAM